MRDRFLMNVLLYMLLVLATTFFHFSARAQEVVDVVRQEKLESSDPASAQTELMNQAVESASLENIKSMIGEDKTERSREAIRNKIIKNSGRYITSMSGQNFNHQGSLYTMDVQLKLSLKALRSILLENGLLYQVDGPPKVLPLVQFTDRINAQSYGWWYNSGAREQGYLIEFHEAFQKALKDEFLKIGFFELSPQVGHFIQAIPEPYRTENLQRADALFISEYFKSSVALRGQISLKQKPGTDTTYVVDVKLEAVHSSNGRLMAEVVRTYETQAGVFQKVVSQKLKEVLPHVAEDLGSQLSEGWRKGTFGASVVKLAVTGSVGPKDIEEFKKAILLQVHDIKSLRERIVESHKTTFEVDSSSVTQQLAQAIRGAKFARFKVQVEEVSNEGLTLKVEPL